MLLLNPTIIYIAIVILVVIIIAVGMLVVYNRFVKNKNQVHDAWFNIDVYLKQRHELVPNLINAVKGYAEHEKNTFEQVVSARNRAVDVVDGDINNRIKAEGDLRQSLKRLFVVVEGYPDLKADNNFMMLQNKLSEIEETLSRTRRYYNATVRVNNTYGESIPGAWLAGIFNYQHFDFYEAGAEEREVTNVNL